jgi:hypothetical protein
MSKLDTRWFGERTVESSLDPLNPTLGRLEDQIQWYDRKSGHNQRSFKVLKIATFAAGAFVPVLASLAWKDGRILAGVAGSLVVVCEGLQQLNQYQANWLTYRSTCEALKHEKFLYLGTAGPYAAATHPLQLLAERIEGLVSQENAKWVASQEQTRQRQSTSDS